AEGEWAIVRPENAPNPKGNPILADPQKFSRVGNSNYYVNGEGGIYRRVGEGAPGRIPLLPDEHARIAASDEVAAKIDLLLVSGGGTGWPLEIISSKGKLHAKAAGEINISAPEKGKFGAIDSGGELHRTVEGEINTNAPKTSSSGTVDSG